MITFVSQLRCRASVALPPWSGTRVMMMPYIVGDPIGSLPEYLHPWGDVLEQSGDIAAACGVDTAAVGYLTIDEAVVAAGETHRRPGLHVDGVGPDGKAGGWGGGGGGWGAKGMLVAASHVGSYAYQQSFRGAPGPDGDCEHLRDQLIAAALVVLQPDRLYHCEPLTVHEALPMDQITRRQFLRVSFPSTAPWYEGYTQNPMGISPTGPIHPRRGAYMAYRSGSLDAR